MHRRGWLHLIAFAVLVVRSPAAAAAEIPAFTAGYWEFKRVVDDPKSGKPLTMSKESCADPTADRKKMNEALVKQGCTFSPIEQQGDAYSFTADCHVEGIEVETRSVLTVESDSAYKVDVTTTSGGQSTREVLKARRLGDC